MREALNQTSSPSAPAPALRQAPSGRGIMRPPPMNVSRGRQGGQSSIQSDSRTESTSSLRSSGGDPAPARGIASGPMDGYNRIGRSLHERLHRTSPRSLRPGLFVVCLARHDVREGVKPFPRASVQGSPNFYPFRARPSVFLCGSTGKWRSASSRHSRFFFVGAWRPLMTSTHRWEGFGFGRRPFLLSRPGLTLCVTDGLGV